MRRIINLSRLSMAAKSAYQALQQALLENGLETTERISSQVIADARLAAHEERRKCRRTQLSVWPYGDIPNADHLTVWRHPDGRLEAVSQPYELDAEGMDALVRYAAQNRLWMYVRADSSWWFPGRTLAVHLIEQAR